MKHWIKVTLVTLGLVVLSILVGWWSTMGKEDVIAKISVSIVSMLLPLLVLHTTLVFQLLNEIRKFAEKRKNVDYNSVLSAIKRNFADEIILIIFAVLVLIGKDYCLSLDLDQIQLCETLIFVIKRAPIIANTFVLFSLFYFLWVIIDEVGGCLDLYKQNTQDTE